MPLSTHAVFQESEAYRPFKFSWAVDLDEEHDRMHWTKEEVPLGDDVTDWKLGRLTAPEKEFVTQILRLFTQSDAAVGSFYHNVLIPVIKNNELRLMLGGFADREKTHQRAYALLNDTLGLPEGDYLAFKDYVEMAEKLEFMLAADNSSLDGLAKALAKGVFNEGVSLFASFVMLLNFQRPEGGGRMKGMCKIVEWSIKDETKHVEGVSRLFRTIVEAHPEIVNDRFKHALYDMARRVVELEDAFVDLAYKAVGGVMPGLTAVEVKQYIRYIADRRLIQLGLKPNFMVAENPLPWLDWVVGAADHTNFFEAKSAEYEVAGLQGDWGYGATYLPGERSFVLYTKKGCPYCDKAKALLNEEGIDFQVHDLSNDAKRQEFYDFHGFQGSYRSVPKIWQRIETSDGPVESYIGGYTELAKLLGAQ